MLEAVTASITHDDAHQAGRDVAAELLEGLGGQPDLVLLFAAAEYDPRRLLDGLYSKLAPAVQLVGCSSYSEISGREALSGSVTAMGLRTGGLGFRTLRAEHDRKDSYAIGRSIGEQARECGAELLVALPDGIYLNSTTFLRGAQDVLGARFPIVGGVAADDLRFERTYQYIGRDVIEGGAVALALQGPLRLATVAQGGWQPIGATRRCTRVEGKVVLELDGQPALNLYREYLGGLGRDLTAGVEFPLGVVGVPGRPRRSDEEILVVRAVQGADEARGGLHCSGDVPEGAEVRMTRASKDDLIRGASDALADVHRRLPSARVALIFDCTGRKIVLGARYKEEIAAAFARLPDDIARVGFYTYGELAPVDGETMHHDETFTAVLIEG